MELKNFIASMQNKALQHLMHTQQYLTSQLNIKTKPDSC